MFRSELKIKGEGRAGGEETKTLLCCHRVDGI